MKKKIFYVYRTARGGNLSQIQLNNEPDHIMYGLTHLQKLGYEVSFSDIAFSKWNILFWFILPIERLVIKLTSVGFKLDQALLLYPKLIKNDIIITTTDSAGLPILFLKMLRLINKPIIYLSVGLINEPFLKKRLFRKIYLLLLKQADFIVTYSQAEERLYKKTFPLLSGKIIFFPFGIDTNFFKSQNEVIKDYILSVGRDKSRNYNLLADLARSLPEQRFVVITSNSNISGIEFSKNVQVLLDQSYLKVKKMYQEAKLIFIPLKEMQRASGQISFLESLASGKKVVVSKIAGITEVYPKLLNKNVYLFNQKRPSDAKSVVLSALSRKLNKKVNVNNSYEYSNNLLSLILSLDNLKICFFGSFDPLYVRNIITIKTLLLNGYEVKFCNYPLNPLRNYLFLFKQFISSCRDSNVIFVGVLGHYDLPLAWLLAKIFRKKLVFDVFISLYDTYVLDREVISPKSLQSIKYYLWDFLSTHLADLVLIDTNTHANYFIKKFRLNFRKVKTLYVGADDEFFKPVIKKKSTKFTVCFYGSFQPLQGVDFIIKSAAFVNDKNIQFRVIGDGQTKRNIVRLAKKLKLKNVKFLPRTSIKGIRREIGNSDICLGIFGSSQKASNVIPNKCYQAIAMGKPVITMDSPAIREVFKDNKDIFLVPNNDPSRLAEAIIKLKNDGELYSRLSKNAYNLFRRKLTPNRLSLDMRKALSELL